MDFEKLAKFAETYLRDYVFSILAVLTSPWDGASARSASEVLTATSGKTWLFAILSLTLGALAYSAGLDPKFSPAATTLISTILAVWLWVLTAVGAHFLAKLMKGRGSFVDTLGVCLRVFPAAYAVAGLVSMTVGFFSRAVSQDFAFLAMVAFLATQFLVIVIGFPVDMSRVHGLGVVRGTVLGALVPLSVLGVNMIGLFLVFATNPPMSRAPTAGPPMRAAGRGDHLPPADTPFRPPNGRPPMK